MFGQPEEVNSTTWVPGLRSVLPCTLLDVRANTRGSKGLWCRTVCDKCLHIGGGWSDCGFVGKHQCFKSDVGGNRKPVEGMQQWCDAGELGKIENKTSRCILDLLQGSQVTHWADLPGVSCSTPVLRWQEKIIVTSATRIDSKTPEISDFRQAELRTNLSCRISKIGQKLSSVEKFQSRAHTVWMKARIDLVPTFTF